MGKPQQQSQPQPQPLPQRREQQQQEQRKPKPPSVVGDAEEEEEEEEEGGSENDHDDDSFFESMDRVPSGVSYDFDDVPSSSTDEDYDDMRFSFASAIAPPPDPRRDDDSSDDGDEDDGFDYGIWMAEPISVDERRRRLLQGFTSSKDMIPAAKSEGRPPPPPAAAAGGENREILASRRRSLKISRSRLSRFSGAPPLPPPSSLTRSRSEILLRVPAGHTPFLRRASSAPPSLCGRPGHRSTKPGARAVAGGGEAAGDGNRACPESGSPADENVCKIKNLDDGKEFVVSGTGRERVYESPASWQVLQGAHWPLHVPATASSPADDTAASAPAIPAPAAPAACSSPPPASKGRRRRCCSAGTWPSRVRSQQGTTGYSQGNVFRLRRLVEANYIN